MDKAILVLGIGNTLLADDGLGPAVLARVRQLLGAPEGVRFVDVATGSLRLAEEIADHKQVVLIDAFATGKAEPGTIYELVLNDTGDDYDLEVLGETPRLGRGVFLRSIGRAWSAHEVDLMTGIKLMVRDLGRTVPRTIYVFGVEAQDTTTFSETLTPKVAAAVEPVAERVASRVNLILEGQPESGGG